MPTETNVGPCCCGSGSSSGSSGSGFQTDCCPNPVSDSLTADTNPTNTACADPTPIALSRAGSVWEGEGDVRYSLIGTDCDGAAPIALQLRCGLPELTGWFIRASGDGGATWQIWVGGLQNSCDPLDVDFANVPTGLANPDALNIAVTL